MFIGERLKELREERNMNQAELGKILNISQQAISCYENNTRDPSTDILNRMAIIFTDMKSCDLF